MSGVARKFGGGKLVVGTPSLGWSSVVVVVSLLTGASIVHNIYKPDLVSNRFVLVPGLFSMPASCSTKCLCEPVLFIFVLVPLLVRFTNIMYNMDKPDLIRACWFYFLGPGSVFIIHTCLTKCLLSELSVLFVSCACYRLCHQWRVKKRTAGQSKIQRSRSLVAVSCTSLNKINLLFLYSFINCGESVFAVDQLENSRLR